MELKLPFISDCPGCNVQNVDTTASCTSPCGYIITPGYPLSYDNNLRSTWTITVGQRKYIDLQFLEFDIYTPPLQKCESDYLQTTDFSLLQTPLDSIR